MMSLSIQKIVKLVFHSICRENQTTFRNTTATVGVFFKWVNV